jgi:hypothetical protein
MRRLLAALAATCVTTALATGCAPTLSGKLTAEDGELTPSSDARVNVVPISPAAGDKAVVVAVASDGTFSTREELPAGDYLVEALVPGYAVASRRVKIGDGEAVDLTLKRVGSDRAPTIGINAEGDGGRGAGGAMLTPPNL